MRARRTWWVVIPALLSLHAGAARAAPWEWGIKAGLNGASFHGDFADVVDPDLKFGFVGGGFAHFRPTPFAALGVEVLYSQKGAKSSLTETDDSGNFIGTFDGFWKFEYIEVPVVLRLAPPIGRLRPELIGGPTFGFNVGAEFEVEDRQTIELHDMEPMDIGVTVGIGGRFHAAGQQFLVEGRYGSGFSDVYDIAGNLESINHVYSLTLGVVR